MKKILAVRIGVFNQIQFDEMKKLDFVPIECFDPENDLRIVTQLTSREMFAAAAMNAMIQRVGVPIGNDQQQRCAAEAFDMADAMMQVAERR